LSGHLQAYAGRDDVVVLALARGGVPVAWEVARALAAELDLLLVQKLGMPQRPELALGAITSGGARCIDPAALAATGVSARQLEEIIAAETPELARREAFYRGTRKAARMEGRTVIVVDDGLATGASMCAALMALRASQPAWIVVAVPVAPRGAHRLIGTAADEFVCVLSPPDFLGVAGCYRDFEPVGDAQVRTLLAAS
jgi:putative phosphoribosyl transferase